ncbi:type II secretion system protein GspL [Shewanella surugensis]|uniref:Type II secretion system protein L n=1 Tax=Shewanella surugensis TaxID=212020 RepID=A0ABT0L8P9_9GAMM|nr:type II secretion system protein GspL [Shewanella surugensis]MCL1124010.1 type II secretion system protein GspL [Shewanella surugensis]
MSERLVIRLGQAAEDACFWLVWSEQEQEIIASGQLSHVDELSSLTERAGHRPVDILIPASTITLTSVELPEGNQRQAIKALPFMLEENLAQDVDELHFVVGKAQGTHLPVGVVAHEQMQTWLAWLTEAELTIQRIVPDCLALPLEECHWAAMKFDGEYLLRTGVSSGMALAEGWIATALPYLLTQTDTDEPVTVATYTELALAGTDLRQQPLELPMLTLAKGLATAPFDLLSGLYKPKREYSKYLSLWGNTAILFGVLFILALINKGLNIYQMDAKAQQFKAQTETIYKQVVPGSSRVVNVRTQLDGYLRSLQGNSSGSSQFFSMLAGIKPAFSQVEELKPTTLRFDAARNELRMQVTAESYGQIEKFKEIVSRSYTLDAGAMNSTDSAVTSTLTIKVK